jgi:hypothetical protein
MSDDQEPRMTRSALAERLTQAGFPVTLGSLNTWTSLGSGPPVAAWWGRRPLYEWAPCLAWAQARLRSQPPASSQRKQKNETQDGAHA